MPARSFDEPFTYEVPAAFAGELQVGSMVEVPVGNAARVGIVAALDVAAPEGVTLKPVARVLDAPPVPADLVALAEWTADSYGCARTRALAMVVPPKFAAHARASAVPQRKRQRAVRRADAMALDTLTGRQRAVVERLPYAWLPVTTALERAGTTRPTLHKLAAVGALELEDRFLDELEEHDEPLDDDASGLGAAAAGSTGALPGAPRTGGDDSAPRPEVQLMPAQLAAVDVIEQGTAADPATVLVGITGSGKTEVYLELIARALARGRDAIVLVPEIALTPQTSLRFVQRFPGMVEVLHSNLTKAEREVAYERIAAGGARVVVGPRSAVFAPLRNLGVVVIDEEHDGSYKQESDPRYDARRVAYRRAAANDAYLVFGSATPRPESWHGIARKAQLRERAGGGRLAPVSLVDLRDEGDSFPITEQVQTAIDATLRRGRKAIVLHNRRGYANALHCRTCGETFRCPNCDVTLVVHGRDAARQRFACHHCGHRAPVPDQCPACSSADIARMGAGTERLERDLVERFGVEVFRLDADATRARGSVAEILGNFAAAGPSILTGTQMVAKGHDFPDVELAVVIDADTALAIPDFRAEERAFSLVAQLAGRAGRSAATSEHARVIVQTWDPEAEFLGFARTHDVEGFLAAELARREAHRYPPYSRLVRLLVSAPTERLVDQWSDVVADGVRRLEVGPVLGPAPLFRVANRFRGQVVVKTDKPTAVARAMRGFLRSAAPKLGQTDVRIAVDVDPQSLI